MSRRHLLIASLTIFIAAVLIGYRTLFSEIKLLSADSTPVKIEVVAVSSLSRVAMELSKAVYLSRPMLFNLLARLHVAESSYQTGYNEVSSGITQ